MVFGCYDPRFDLGCTGEGPLELAKCLEYCHPVVIGKVVLDLFEIYVRCSEPI